MVLIGKTLILVLTNSITVFLVIMLFELLKNVYYIAANVFEFSSIIESKWEKLNYGFNMHYFVV